MEISLSLNLTPSSPSLSTRHPPRFFSFSSSNSAFFTTTNSLFNGTNQKATSLVLGKPRTRIQRGKKGFSCNALFGLGVPELAVIAGVAALVFGPKKLPEVGKSIGKTVKSFQQAAKEFESEIKKEPESETEGSEEKPKAVGSEEEEKQDAKVSSSKESV